MRVKCVALISHILIQNEINSLSNNLYITLFILMRTSVIFCSVFLGIVFSLSYGATHFISDQLPEGTTLADYGLGVRDSGPASRAVRLVELATLPGAGQVQQIVGRGDSLFVGLKEGRIWEYSLEGEVASGAFLDIPQLRTGFEDIGGWTPARGLRGFAFHPGYDTNGLFYTLHKEASDGSTPEYGKSYLYAEYVLGEWDFHNTAEDGSPSFRLLFRIRFEDDWHPAQYLGFNPVAQPGDADYGMLYGGFGDNGVRIDGVYYAHERRDKSDFSNVGQDFNSIQAGIIRIHPLDPSSKTDSELAEAGLKRSGNGKFSIPLDNPFVGEVNHKEELFAKGFRNPLSFSFSPSGALVVADVGEQSVEEINVITPGGNYGWPNREGTFLVPWADQIDGSPLGADVSMRWLPSGEADDPAVTFYVRDKDQTNLRQETLARSGEHDDGFEYPLFQFTHEGNSTTDTLDGLTAIIGGDYYEGFWAEELEGLYLFGNISTDQIFYGSAAALDSGAQNEPILELPLVDVDGNPVELATIIGSGRANMRFGKDRYGNIYMGSKTNKKLYRFQGTPELKLEPAGASVQPGNYFEFALERPPADENTNYILEVSEDLAAGFQPAEELDQEVVSVQSMANGKERVLYRYLKPIDSGKPRFFRFNW